VVPDRSSEIICLATVKADDTHPVKLEMPAHPTYYSPEFRNTVLRRTTLAKDVSLAKISVHNKLRAEIQEDMVDHYTSDSTTNLALSCPHRKKGRCRKSPYVVTYHTNHISFRDEGNSSRRVWEQTGAQNHRQHAVKQACMPPKRISA